MRLTLGVALCYATLLVGCDDPPAPASNGDLSGTYGYLAHLGPVDVVTGIVHLSVLGDSSVTGTWDLQRVPGTDSGLAVGPQLGTGTLQGRRLAGGMWIDLNPGWADNNVVLSLLPAASGTLTGTWGHSTIVGPVAGGPVQLQRLVR